MKPLILCAVLLSASFAPCCEVEGLTALGWWTEGADLVVYRVQATEGQYVCTADDFIRVVEPGGNWLWAVATDQPPEPVPPVGPSLCRRFHLEPGDWIEGGGRELVLVRSSGPVTIWVSGWCDPQLVDDSTLYD